MTPNTDRYITDAARRHCVSADSIWSDDRHRRVVNARCEVMRRLRHDGLSLPAIGRELGKDHTTVMYGLKREGPGLWFG